MRRRAEKVVGGDALVASSRSSIAKVLKDEGYIDDFAVRGEAGKPQLEIGLKYYAAAR